MCIFLIISNSIKNVIIEYCLSLNKNIKNCKLIYYPNDELKYFDENNLYIFFGLMYVNYPIINKKNVYYVNLEQLTMNGTHSKYDVLTPILKNGSKLNLIDYNFGNISILKKYNINSIYLPYQVNFDEIYNYKKIYNFCVCCSWNSRIKNIYDKVILKFDNCISIGNPVKWGVDRDNILFKTKVLANIHHREFDYNILEEIRITRCVLNKIIVISEYSLEWEKYPLSNYIIFINYDNMIDKIYDVLNNYEKYYNEIYNNFDITEINFKLNKYLEFFNNFNNVN